MRVPQNRLILLLSAVVGAGCLSTHSDRSISGLFRKAQRLITQKRADDAFSVLFDVYKQDPTFPGLNSQFESCFRLKVDEDEDDAQARFGLVSLLLDQERFDEASQELGYIVDSDDPFIREKAASQLFRTNAAMCNWETVVKDGKTMVASLRLEERSKNSDNPDDVPLVHPFEALKWPCISLSDATQIAGLYARRWMASQGFVDSLRLETGRQQPLVDVVKSRERKEHDPSSSSMTTRKIRLGYVSPDFTATHPMAFLIQSIFQYHDRDQFSVHIYSLGSKIAACPEVDAILDGSDAFTLLSLGETPSQLAEKIRDDDLDVLVDLCGYTGTSKVAELLSHRPARIQIAYMGYPASSGAPFIDYMIADQIVVPPSLRKHYTEGMIWMPNCYFVNSHVFCAKDTLLRDEAERSSLREQYNLPADGFVFCAHNRPDKIDYTVFQVWLEALSRLRQHTNKNAVLWLLRSGSEMERNLRRKALEDFRLSTDALVFCDVAPRTAHLKRLGCADVFLDTPSYNAHTVGCDVLFSGTPVIGVPMISLLRPEGVSNDNSDPYFVPTEKLASRVGASLLSSVGLEDFIVPDLASYGDLMIRCATDREWFGQHAERLARDRLTSPLFDTKRWVQSLDAALRHIALNHGTPNDVLVEESLW